MKKNVWILNHYAGNQFFDKGGRHYSFAKYLGIDNYKITIFCCNAAHWFRGYFINTKKLAVIKRAKEINTDFVFVKAREYSGNGKQRILNMIEFYVNVQKIAKRHAEKYGRPDIILASSVHPLTLAAGIKLAKLYGIKCICEIRDLWPETIVAMGIASKNNPCVLMLRKLEKVLYKKADAIIFTMEGGYEYIREQKWDKCIPESKVFNINNGVDLEVFDANISKNMIEDADLCNDEYFKLVYTGSIRQANGVEEILDCAKCLINEHKIKFLIYGDGDYLEKIRTRIEKESLTNILIKGMVLKEMIPFILSKGNLNILNFNIVGARSGLYRFGNSQNKLFEYLASGRPVIANLEPQYNLITRYKCGISRNMQDGNDYADAVQMVLNLKEEVYSKMCSNARRAAEQYDFSKLTKDLIQIIESL